MPDYTSKELVDLRRQIDREPIERPLGRAICPFCRHKEARWRRTDEADRSIEVRVLCSQCQRLGRWKVDGRLGS